ncbi:MULTISPECIES: methyltransferase domain-containing protein [unclassified Microcoleus]|uniref:methyltransferase domain-containing protein n=1 Tax=unclassified Microcoleus TaxID=2642155 RepID=UPI002FD1EF2C
MTIANLTAQEIQARIFQYASLKKEVQVKNSRSKSTCINVRLSEFTEGIKVSVQENSSSQIFLNSIDDEGFIEYETNSLDAALGEIQGIAAINIDAKGAAPKILKGMQKLIANNPQVTIYMVFNSDQIQAQGVNPKKIAYQLLTMGFSVAKYDNNSQLKAVSESELLGNSSVNLILKKIIFGAFVEPKAEENPLWMQIIPAELKIERAETKPRSNLNYYHPEIPNPQKQGGVPHGPESQEKVFQRLIQLGIDVEDYKIDVDDYRKYFQAARYAEDFPDYYSFNLPEKALEHYIAAKLLQLNNKDIYIDIASQHSPTPTIYSRLFGVNPYLQDLDYPQGLHGNMIGGDAANMAVPDGFASKMALHCSFEHFENSSDMGFIREVSRVLRPGGAICILPLYMFDEYAIQTDPAVSIPQEVKFDDDATVYCAYGWGNRHGRFYDPEHLLSRVCNNLNGMKLKVYKIVNAKQVDQSCYVQFAGLIQKPIQDKTLLSEEKYAHALRASGITV